MQVLYVASFGDSWTWGDELDDETREQETFTSLVAAHYGATPHNCGEKGSSQISARNQFLQYLEQYKDTIHKTIFLMGLTHPQRMSWIDAKTKPILDEDQIIPNNHVDSSMLGCVDSNWDMLMKMHYTLAHNTFTDRLTHHQTLSFFDGLAARQNLRMLQFNYTKNIPLDYLTIPTLMRKGTPLDTMMKRDMFAPKYHPNKEGHKFIANLILSELNILYGQ